MDLQLVKYLCNNITMQLFGVTFSFRVERDNKRPEDGRIFIQIVYETPCNKTGEKKEWHGRKWYLSDYMTEDEIVKTAWCAYESVVKHETMETFRVFGKLLFNPHVHYRSLLEVSEKEISRDIA